MKVKELINHLNYLVNNNKDLLDSEVFFTDDYALRKLTKNEIGIEYLNKDLECDIDDIPFNQIKKVLVIGD